MLVICPLDKSTALLTKHIGFRSQSPGIQRSPFGRLCVAPPVVDEGFSTHLLNDVGHQLQALRGPWMSIWGTLQVCCPEQHNITKTSTQYAGHLRGCRVLEIHLWPLARTPGEQLPARKLTVCIRRLFPSCWMMMPGKPRCETTFQGIFSSHSSWLPGAQQTWAPLLHAQKLGKSGKPGSVFFMAAVGRAECLWPTFGRAQLPCLSGSTPLPQCWDQPHFYLVLLICSFPRAAVK